MSLGTATRAIPVYAQISLSDSPAVLSAADIATLKQTLDTLQNILITINTRLGNESLNTPNRLALSNALAGIKMGLIKLNSAIQARKFALTPPRQVAPQQTPQVGTLSPELTAPLSAVGPQAKTTPIPENIPQVAVARAGFDPKNLGWLGLIVLLGLGLVFYYLRRKANSEPAPNIITLPSPSRPEINQE